MTTRLVWLSFAGEEGFRGVAVVPITDDEIDVATEVATKMRVLYGMPESHEPMVVGAAVTKAKELGCNPGGQVTASDINPDRFPVDCIGRLMQKDELIERRLGDIIAEDGAQQCFVCGTSAPDRPLKHKRFKVMFHWFEEWICRHCFELEGERDPAEEGEWDDEIRN